MSHDDIRINRKETIKTALKRLDKTGKKVLLVTTDDNRLLGTVTDGDIRRYILRGKNLENGVKEICNTNPFYIKQKGFSTKSAKEMLVENKIQLLPVVDEENRVVDFVTWDKLLSDGETEPLKTSKINIPVVIMAGGKGTRLDPFTRILPKPLIPVGDKPIIEIIIEEFQKQGVQKYYLMLNHKSEMIEVYFSGVEKDYELSYIKENAYLGTAGGLKLLDGEISDYFIVSNCDVIVKANFQKVLSFHKEQKAVLTILSSIQHHRLPYGVIKFKEGGEVTEIHEKPEYTFTVNTGVYILSRSSLEFVPEDSCFDMTDLISCLSKNNEKVFTYPVNEEDYIDMGQWKEYRSAVEKLQSFS